MSRDQQSQMCFFPHKWNRPYLIHVEAHSLNMMQFYQNICSGSLTALSLLLVHQQKQMRLGDKMDLWSYLLKPVQRISKYSLLLQDMMRECGPGQTREMSEVQAALEVIHFQLRHGNNLLAMDAIHNCDVGPV